MISLYEDVHSGCGNAGFNNSPDRVVTQTADPCGLVAQSRQIHGDVGFCATGMESAR